MPGSMHAVETQLAHVAAVPAVFRQRLEYRAAGHRAGIDVQADGDRAVAGIADAVVFVRRDQAAGGAGAGLDRTHRLEAVALRVVFQQFVLHDLQRPVPHALDAPHAVVVVDRRTLARSPGHRHHAVAVLLAAVQPAAGIVFRVRLEHACGQGHRLVADQLAQAVAQAVGEFVRGGFDHGGVDRVDQGAAAGEIQGEHGGLG